jgi:hypothetical protein
MRRRIRREIYFHKSLWRPRVHLMWTTVLVVGSFVPLLVNAIWPEARLPFWTPILPLACLYGAAMWWVHLKWMRYASSDRLVRILNEAGYCVSCGYNLAGNVSGKCPECGKAVSPPPAEKS